jgi:hypothetical protein
MAASKSAARKSAAKKARKTPKSRAAAKKAAKTRKPRAAGKKTAARRKTRPAVKKPVATRKTKATAATRVKTVISDTPLQRPRPPEVPRAVTELDERIAIVRNNLRELVEQAASLSGASDEELMSRRITEQEARLQLLIKQREELSQRGS